jgi:hypothetical protein
MRRARYFSSRQDGKNVTLLLPNGVVACEGCHFSKQTLNVLLKNGVLDILFLYLCSSTRTFGGARLNPLSLALKERETERERG